ncbi:hypothetical protein KC644_02830 [Candidatus Berkelbacteria bacterium]|nr:hypothetical protein [Candidatus Berkelbacteria bacterium]
MNIGSSISKAWQLTLRHKVLWFFGLFATGFNTEIWEIGSGIINFIPQAASRAQLPLELPTGLQQAWIEPVYAQSILPTGDLVQKTPVVITVTVIIALVVVYLRLVSQIALFDAVAKANTRKKIVFKKQVSLANQLVIKYLGLTLYLALWALLPTAVIFLVIGILVIFGLPQWLLVILSILTLATWVLYVLGLGVVTRFATRAVVLNNVSIISSLSYAFALIHKNPADTFLLWVSATGLSLAYYFVLSMVGMIGLISILAAALILAPLSVLIALLFGLILALIYSWGSTFISSLWTLAYFELNKTTK